MLFADAPMFKFDILHSNASYVTNIICSPTVKTAKQIITEEEWIEQILIIYITMRN